MHVAESIYTTLLLFSAGLSIVAPLVSWYYGRSFRSLTMVVVALGTAAITLGAAGTYLATEIHWALLWTRVENIGYAFLVPAWLVFTIRYLRLGVWIKRWLYPLLLFFAVVTTASALGPPTPLTWSNPRFETVGNQLIFTIDRGIVVWIAFSFTVVLALVVMALFLNASTKVSPYYRWRIRLVPLAMLIPFYAALHDTFSWQPLPYIRLVPLAFAFFSLMLFITVVHQRLGDLVPIARDLLLDNLYEAVVVVDAEGRVVDLNSVTAALAGVNEQGAMGSQLTELLPGLGGHLAEDKKSRGHEFEVELQGRSGARIYEVRLSPVLGAADQFMGQVLVLRDITERKASEAKLRYMALHDDMTGLANRAALMERVARAQERSRRQTGYNLALLFIDLDRLKAVNDSLGHAAGDELLIKVAARLEEKARKVDTVARLGGDEFVVLLEGVGSEADAYRAAERMFATFEEPFEIAGRRLTIQASIGFLYGLEAEDSPTANLDRADLAMYQAKALGGGRIIGYQIDLEHERAQLEQELYDRRRRG